MLSNQDQKILISQNQDKPNLSQNPKYFDDLNSSLQILFDQSLMTIDNPLDSFVWGYLAALYEKTQDPSKIIQKIGSIIQLTNTKVISNDEKMQIYSYLATDINFNMDNYINSKFENIYNIRQSNYLNSQFNIQNYELFDDTSLKEQKKIEEEIKIQQIMKIVADEEFKSLNNECQICMEDFSNDQFTIMTGCRHKFHRDCIKDYLVSQINEGKVPIKCPEECKESLSTEELLLALDEDMIEKYNKYSLKNYIDSNPNEGSWCPTPNCPFAFIKEENNPKFLCPLCTKTYCLNCRVEDHIGQTCQEWKISNRHSEDDKKFDEFIKGQKFKQCFKCTFWVEKAEGCNYMKCRCGNEFCYSCGNGRGKCKCGGFSGH